MHEPSEFGLIRKLFKNDVKSAENSPNHLVFTYPFEDFYNKDPALPLMSNGRIGVKKKCDMWFWLQTELMGRRILCEVHLQGFRPSYHRLHSSIPKLCMSYCIMHFGLYIVHGFVAINRSGDEDKYKKWSRALIVHYNKISSQHSESYNGIYHRISWWIGFSTIT